MLSRTAEPWTRAFQTMGKNFKQDVEFPLGWGAIPLGYSPMQRQRTTVLPPLSDQSLSLPRQLQ